MPQYATPRWKRIGRRRFRLQNGKIFRLSLFSPKEADLAVTRLPYEYLELGDYAADLALSERAARKALEPYQQRIDEINEKAEAAASKQDPVALATILMTDLETALNMLSRYAGALGMGPGPLADELNALLSKYGMRYAGADPNFYYVERRRKVND